MRVHFIKMAIYMATLIALCDQFTKSWVVRNVMSPPSYYPVASFIDFTLVWNKGITFGLMNRVNHLVMPYILIAASMVVLALLARWLWHTSSLLVTLALGSIMGGALGNIIDRIRYGAVVDFIDVYYGNYHWYTFNLADAAIVSGVILLSFDSLVRGK